ncbi:MAG TPA: sigma factor, partial [Planctomycetia bacterium]|nr:sigma factor [Planctomycetia bacterium]
MEPPVRDSAPLTHWSAIAAAQGRDPKAQQALDELCRVYWPVIYAYLRRLVNDPENAADLTQGFFARLLERNWLAQADAARGRFRSFLRAAARNYWLNERRAAAAAKRGGGWRPTPIELAAWDERLARTEGGAAPDAEFDREWAVALLARASD